MRTKTVPCMWVACGCGAFDSCDKCGGVGGRYWPAQRVEVTASPWAGQFGTVEHEDGAYFTIRLDSSEHVDDVLELYPNEFTVLCQKCEHDKHEPGKCEVLYLYARGPNDPPGNQGCLCGVDLGTLTVNVNNNEGWVSKQFYTEKTLQQKLAQVARDTCREHKGAGGCCYVVNLAVATAIENYEEEE